MRLPSDSLSAITIMINLLPQTEKRSIRHAYHLRVVALAFFFLGLVIMFANIMLVPSYLLSAAKERVLSDKLSDLKKSSSVGSDKTLTATIADINGKLGVLAGAQQQFSISGSGIDAILAKKTPEITLSQIAFAKNAAGANEFSIAGIAADRASLLAFVKSLQSDASFNGVDLPVSSFVKENDIDFSLEFTIQQ